MNWVLRERQQSVVHMNRVDNQAFLAQSSISRGSETADEPRKMNTGNREGCLYGRNGKLHVFRRQ